MSDKFTIIQYATDGHIRNFSANGASEAHYLASLFQAQGDEVGIMSEVRRSQCIKTTETELPTIAELRQL